MFFSLFSSRSEKCLMFSVNGLREFDGVEMILFLLGNVWFDIGILGVSSGMFNWDFIDNDLEMVCFFSDKVNLMSWLVLLVLMLLMSLRWDDNSGSIISWISSSVSSLFVEHFLLLLLTFTSDICFNSFVFEVLISSLNEEWLLLLCWKSALSAWEFLITSVQTFQCCGENYK